MFLISNIAVGLIALVNIYILVLEMFLWTKPVGRKAFGLSQEFAIQTKVLGANQGLYNGFLAAGLIYGLLQGTSGYAPKVFFLVCVLVAGLYGAASASRKNPICAGNSSSHCVSFGHFYTLSGNGP